MSDWMRIKTLYEVVNKKRVVLAVNASTTPEYSMDEANKQPSIEETMSAMSGVQLHRYNAASIDLVKATIHKWADGVSTPESPLTPYFIEVTFSKIKYLSLRPFLITDPTSFSLRDDQVDKLIEAGRQLL